ncbi:alpha/beta fold hydrolase [Brachybacterium sp. GCM10030267]|uniref:alpha/beta fold hydrolase n=1 Tax=Brachybacterium sp. GCM10030267 TaxID=3273381 RepID=UPI00360F0E2D
MAGTISTPGRLFGEVSLHLEDTGDHGRPVVLLHGWPLSSASWVRQVPILRRAGYRVIAYDRRGSGRSSKPATGYGYDTLADDLAAVLEELDLREVSLVGFSMGGGEVVRYIRRHGEDRLRSIVLASAVTPMMLRTPGNPDGPLPPAQAAGMAKDLALDPPGFYDSFLREVFSTADGLQVTEQQLADALAMCHQATRPAALATMDAFGRTDFRKDLEQITVPTLILHGDGDRTVPCDGSAKRTYDAVAHSEMHVIRGGPHGIPLSHPAAFNGALLDFLARYPGSCR